MMKKTVSLILLILLVSSAYSLLNPADEYCKKLGYRIENRKNADGAYTVCTFPDGTSADTWDFLRGKVAVDFNYCTRHGYATKTVADRAVCSSVFSDTCAVCVLQNKSEIEVSRAMELNLSETHCGDGICGFPENHRICAADCSSGGRDAYCDSVEDGICDPDCTGDADTDCMENQQAGEPAPVCGNSRCEKGEETGCREDCAASLCGNGICESGEKCSSDCAKKGSPLIKFIIAGIILIAVAALAVIIKRGTTKNAQ